MTITDETPAIISPKRYKCERCGHEEIHKTNHYGPTWSLGHYATCPKCPPWAKYPEFGGNTTWLCVETPHNKAIVTYKPQQYWNDLLNIWNCEPAFNKAQQGETRIEPYGGGFAIVWKDDEYPNGENWEGGYETLEAAKRAAIQQGNN